MEKCSCYHTRKKHKYFYNTFTGEPQAYDKIIGICWGTQECEECSCNGDRNKCDFYPEVRLKAQKEKIEYKINKAINLLIDNGYEVKKI